MNLVLALHFVSFSFGSQIYSYNTHIKPILDSARRGAKISVGQQAPEVDFIPLKPSTVEDSTSPLAHAYTALLSDLDGSLSKFYDEADKFKEERDRMEQQQAELARRETEAIAYIQYLNNCYQDHLKRVIQAEYAQTQHNTQSWIDYFIKPSVQISETPPPDVTLPYSSPESLHNLFTASLQRPLPRECSVTQNDSHREYANTRQSFERARPEKRRRSTERLSEAPQKKRRMSETRHEARSKIELFKDIPNGLKKIRLGPISDSRICIFNLNPRTKLKVLEGTFCQYGRIVSSKMFFDEDPHHRNFATIQFDDSKSAKKALEWNSRRLDGQHLGVILCQELFDRSTKKIKVLFPLRMNIDIMEAICSCSHRSLKKLSRELIDGFKISSEKGSIGYLLFRSEAAQLEALDILKHVMNLKAIPTYC